MADPWLEHWSIWRNPENNTVWLSGKRDDGRAVFAPVAWQGCCWLGPQQARRLVVTAELADGRGFLLGQTQHGFIMENTA